MECFNFATLARVIICALLIKFSQLQLYLPDFQAKMLPIKSPWSLKAPRVYYS